MLLVEPPAWFADNITQICLVALVVVTIVVLRLVKGTAMRVILLLLIAAVAVVVYVNREPLKACARTCECQIRDHEINVPACDVDLSAIVTSRASALA